MPCGGPIEASIIIVGVPVHRDGIAQCAGSMLKWHSRRLTRVCRSSAQSEALALSNCGELTLYCQIVVAEVFSGEFQIQFLRQAEACTMVNPFKKSASPADILAELKMVPISKPPCVVSKRASAHATGIVSLCGHCFETGSSMWSEVIPSYLSVFGTRDVNTSRPSVHAIVLSDCANVVSSLTGNPRCREKSSRLIRSHLQELKKFMAISYCSAPMNIADVGAKVQRNLSIYRQFVSEGSFSIGFLSRSECKVLMRSNIGPYSSKYFKWREKRNP